MLIVAKLLAFVAAVRRDWALAESFAAFVRAYWPYLCFVAGGSVLAGFVVQSGGLFGSLLVAACLALFAGIIGLARR